MTITATRTIRIVVDSSSAQRNTQAATEKLNQNSFAANKLAAAIGGVVSAYAALNAVKSIAGIGDEFAKITGLLRNATSSQQEFTAALELSKQVAETTRASLTGTVETFAALNRVTQGTGRSQLELFGILETVNKSIALTSPNAQSASAALTQFGQALGGDFKAGAQELNSILEQAPGLAEAVARGLGVPTASLKKMGEEGQLSAEKVLNALQDVADDIDKRFEKIPKTVSGTLQLIKNDLLVTFGENDVASPLVGSLEELRDTLNDPAVKEGIITLSKGLITFTGWMAKAAAATADFAKSLGYYAAAFSGQVTELDRLEQRLKEAKNQSTSWFSGEASKQDARNAMEFYQTKIDAIKNGTDGMRKAASGGYVPEAPRVAAPQIQEGFGYDPKKITQDLQDSYDEQERLAEQHARNMEAIDRDFWSSVDREGKETDAIAGSKRTTDSMILELQSRADAAQFYRDLNASKDMSAYEQEAFRLKAETQMKVAEIDRRAAEDSARREAALTASIDYETMSGQTIQALRDEARDQDLIADMTYYQQKVAIQQDAANRAQEIAKAEKEAKIKLGFDLASSGLAILQTFGSQSEKSQKKMAKVGIAMDTARGVAAGVRLGWPMGIPAVAWALVNGKKALDSLNKAGSGSIDGGGGGGIGSVPALPTTASQSSGEQFQQKQVIEIRGIDKDSLITGDQLIGILQTSDNVIVALNGAQADAQRRGVI